MANIIEIPKCNPLKFYVQSDWLNNLPVSWNANIGTFNPNFNFKNLDEDFFSRILPNWVDATNYAKPFQQGDAISMQFIGRNVNMVYAITLINCEGKVVKSMNATPQTILTGAVNRAYNFVMQLYDVPEGYYFIQIKQYDSTQAGIKNTFDFLSELIHIKQVHENTSLLLYTNSYNDQNVFFDVAGGQYFAMRVHGTLVDVLPTSDFEVYENQNKDLVMLNGKAFRQYEFQVGIDGLITDHVLDQLNSIFLMDSIYIDSVQVTRIEGANFEPNRTDKASKFNASLKVRETSPKDSLEVAFFQDIEVMDLPPTDSFFIGNIQDITTGTPIITNKFFSSYRNLIDALNSYISNLRPYDSGYFSINAKNKIVWRSANTTAGEILYTLYVAGFQVDDLYPYKLELDVKPNSVAGFGVVISLINGTAINYAIDWGDGTATTLGSGTTPTLTKTYSSSGNYKVRLFVDDCTDYDLNSSDQIIDKISGKLAPSTLTFTGSNIGLSEVTNNIFTNVGALQIASFDVSNNNIGSTFVSTLIQFMYDSRGLFDSFGTQTMQSQTPLSPPNEDVVLLKNQIDTLILTD